MKEVRVNRAHYPQAASLMILVIYWIGLPGSWQLNVKELEIRDHWSVPLCKSLTEKSLVMYILHIKILSMQFKAPRLLNDAVQTN
jgi:hypothetical protein